MPDEHPSRLRLYRRGVCLKDVKGKAKMVDIQLPSNVMDAMKAELKADVTKKVLKELISKRGAIVPGLSNHGPEVLQGLVESPGDAGSAPNQNGASSSGARSSRRIR